MRRTIQTPGFALLFVLTLAFSVPAQGNGKGKGGGGSGGEPPPPPPTAGPFPVQYRVTYLDNIFGADKGMWPRAMNDLGIVVGSVRGELGGIGSFMALPDGSGAWETLDLNALDAEWVDLDTGLLTSEWYGIGAYGINNLGQVSGLAANSNSPYYYRAYLLEFVDDIPSYTLLPDTGIRLQNPQINDRGVVYASEESGDLVAFMPWNDYLPTILSAERPTSVYGINNSGVIATGHGEILAPTSHYPDGTYDYTNFIPTVFESMSFWDINNLDIACGDQQEIVVVEGKGRKQTTTVIQEAGPIIVDTLTGGGILLDSPRYNRVTTGINDVGDVINASGFLFATRDGQRQALNVDDMVVNKGPIWADAVINQDPSIILINNPNETTDPAETGFGMLCGQLQQSVGGDVAFVLVPEPYVAP